MDTWLTPCAAEEPKYIHASSSTSTCPPALMDDAETTGRGRKENQRQDDDDADGAFQCSQLR